MVLEKFSLAGKTALVTGASSGIGFVVAKGLAEAGARVVAAARRKDRVAELVADIAAAGGVALGVAMDVTSKTSIAAAYDEAQSRFGVVDVIVNNAGISAPMNFMKVDEQTRDSVFDTNFKGVWDVAQEGARRMIKAGRGGSIVNVSSVLGLAVQSGQSAYCASKGAVIQLTRAMSIDLMKYAIRVNTVAPGWFKTELNSEFFETSAGLDYIRRMPARRLGELDELVGPIILLASAAGSFVNGSVLVVDGALNAVVA
ncbi:MAG: SDR family oxidoreductase [Sphingomonadales bacterium]|nr:SDR family oxidoreductase [Sphingomonadales bacterium]